MNAVKCPVNSVEFAFFLSLLTFTLYIVVSLLTRREPFNLERMLHRGKYSLDGKRELKLEWSLRNVFRMIIGITPEYSKGDRAIAYSMFAYSFVYGFCLRFLGTVIWNAITPWPIKYWSWYFVIVNFVIFGAVTLVSSIWFGVGGVCGLLQLFRDLKARTAVNDLDDGRVEGSMSLADKQVLEAVDSQHEKG
ncbi:MAG: hypothetical protein IJJ33_18025 [Victivallales bacterium]|nr:hypothetical protein [Victivallales bacterium]